MIFVSILWELFYIFLCSFLILSYLVTQYLELYEPPQMYVQQVIFVMVRNVHDDMSEQISLKKLFFVIWQENSIQSLVYMHDGSFDKVLDPPCFLTSNDDDGNYVFVFLWNSFFLSRLDVSLITMDHPGHYVWKNLWKNNWICVCFCLENVFLPLMNLTNNSQIIMPPPYQTCQTFVVWAL